MKIIKLLLKIIFTTIKIAMFVFIGLFIFVVVMQRFSNNKISFGGYRLFTVVTSSMSPVYEVGDVLLSKEVDVNTLKVGEDISYLGNYGSFTGKVVTHRIEKILKNDDGTLTIQTKGVNNPSADPIITGDQVYGKIVRKVESLSWIKRIISTDAGFFLCIFIPLTYVIGSELIESGIERYKKKHNISEE